MSSTSGRKNKYNHALDDDFYFDEIINTTTNQQRRENALASANVSTSCVGSGTGVIAPTATAATAAAMPTAAASNAVEVMKEKESLAVGLPAVPKTSANPNLGSASSALFVGNVTVQSEVSPTRSAPQTTNTTLNANPINRIAVLDDENSSPAGITVAAEQLYPPAVSGGFKGAASTSAAAGEAKDDKQQNDLLSMMMNQKDSGALFSAERTVASVPATVAATATNWKAATSGVSPAPIVSASPVLAENVPANLGSRSVNRPVAAPRPPLTNGGNALGTIIADRGFENDGEQQSARSSSSASSTTCCGRIRNGFVAIYRFILAWHLPQWALVGCLFFLVEYLNKTLAPSCRPLPDLSDPAFGLPFVKKERVPSRQLPLLTLVPIFGVFIPMILLWRSTTRFYFRELNAWTLYLCMCTVITFGATISIKFMGGRHRPDFLARLKMLGIVEDVVVELPAALLLKTTAPPPLPPSSLSFAYASSLPAGTDATADSYSSSMLPTTMATMIIPRFTAGFNATALCDPIYFDDKTHHLLREGRLSFPSGHSSYATATMTPLFLFLASRLRPFYHGCLFRFLLCVSAPFGVCVYILMSRVLDNRHNYTDVLAGAVLGVLCAVALFPLFFTYIERHDTIGLRDVPSYVAKAQEAVAFKRQAAKMKRVLERNAVNVSNSNTAAAADDNADDVELILVSDERFPFSKHYQQHAGVHRVDTNNFNREGGLGGGGGRRGGRIPLATREEDAVDMLHNDDENGEDGSSEEVARYYVSELTEGSPFYRGCC